ncbi:hypothetical protein GS531_24990 [Rhodococcus hoagii]|nr:hypothetical protein [Prescottella equi]
MRARPPHDGAGQNLFTAESAPDLHVPNNHTLIVGDPQGEYVEIRFPVMGGWRLADQEVDLSTAAEAIAEARDRLATTPSPAHPVAVEHQLSERPPSLTPDVPTAVHPTARGGAPRAGPPAVRGTRAARSGGRPAPQSDGSITWTTPDGGAVHTPTATNGSPGPRGRLHRLASRRGGSNSGSTPRTRPASTPRR